MGPAGAHRGPGAREGAPRRHGRTWPCPGLEPAATAAFFSAQIEAAKRVQRADFRRWEAEPPPATPELPDLSGVLRPRIDAINRDLLAALARLASRPEGRRETGEWIRRRAEVLLTGDAIDAETRAAAIAPLLAPAR